MGIWGKGFTGLWEHCQVSGFIPNYLIKWGTDADLPEGLMTSISNCKILMFISFYPKNIFHLLREEGNEGEGKGRSAVAGVAGGKEYSLGSFPRPACCSALLKKGCSSFIELQKNRHSDSTLLLF